MESIRESDLKSRIIQEMTVDYANALEKNFDLAKQLIRITKDGKVDVAIKDRLTGKENILLYLIGKLYAKEAERAATSDVGSQELMNELGLPKGSLYPWLKDLREEHKISQTTRGRYTYYAIAHNVLERTLKDISKKLYKEGTGDAS